MLSFIKLLVVGNYETAVSVAQLPKLLSSTCQS